MSPAEVTCPPGPSCMAFLWLVLALWGCCACHRLNLHLWVLAAPSAHPARGAGQTRFALAVPAQVWPHPAGTRGSRREWLAAQTLSEMQLLLLETGMGLWLCQPQKSV